MSLDIDHDQSRTQNRDSYKENRCQVSVHGKDKVGRNSQIEWSSYQHSDNTDIGHSHHTHISRQTHDDSWYREFLNIFKTVFLNLGKHCQTDISDKSGR